MHEKDTSRYAVSANLESIPPDDDIYVMKQVLHDWDDLRALAILKNSGGYAGAKRMQWFLAVYAQKFSDARKLGIRALGA
jgi:hypothetical protein